ncbi:hypothetical protein D3C86_1231980 [compost metagenome]
MHGAARLGGQVGGLDELTDARGDGHGQARLLTALQELLVDLARHLDLAGQAGELGLSLGQARHAGRETRLVTLGGLEAGLEGEQVGFGARELFEQLQLHPLDRLRGDRAAHQASNLGRHRRAEHAEALVERDHVGVIRRQTLEAQRRGLGCQQLLLKGAELGALGQARPVQGVPGAHPELRAQARHASLQALELDLLGPDRAVEGAQVGDRGPNLLGQGHAPGSLLEALEVALGFGQPGARRRELLVGVLETLADALALVLLVVAQIGRAEGLDHLLRAVRLAPGAAHLEQIRPRDRRHQNPAGQLLGRERPSAFFAQVQLGDDLLKQGSGTH